MNAADGLYLATSKSRGTNAIHERQQGGVGMKTNRSRVAVTTATNSGAASSKYQVHDGVNLTLSPCQYSPLTREMLPSVDSEGRSQVIEVVTNIPQAHPLHGMGYLRRIITLAIKVETIGITTCAIRHTAHKGRGHITGYRGQQGDICI